MATASTTPFFGRAYSLVITPSQGPSAGTPIVVSSDQFEPEALRFTFDMTQTAFKRAAYWQAEITIYNCDGPITAGPSAGVNLFEATIQEGDRVTVCAGYQADYPAPSTPPVIWEGLIYYSIKDRLDVVDQRLTLHCLVNRVMTSQNFINETLPALSTQVSQAQFIAQESVTPIGMNSSQVASVLDSKKTQLPRAKTYFGSPQVYLDHLANQANAVTWFDSEEWSLAKLESDPLGDVLTTYAPCLPGQPPQYADGVTYSLIGTPQQTQYGVTFRTLLDPRVQVAAPIMQVRVPKQYVRQTSFDYPITKGGMILPLPPTDAYGVIQVRFVGDTRGNDWCSEITGISQIKSVLALIGA